MEWLLENWIIVALFGGMAAMHLVGHRRGGGGGHGCCGGGGHDHAKGGSGKKKPDAENARPE
jgi:hypothetical protein